MLGPSIDEENQIDDVTGQEALFHFFAIGWNVLFALIPPRRYANGAFAFFVALAFIGFCTAIVAEFANLLGCASGLKTSVTAITLVALGTSLPDTLASKIAAQNSDNADSAIGNITGSNSVNVFLGLGLPWVIATIYRKATTGEDYAVPSGTLAFSVMLFLCTACCCFIILIARRKVSFSNTLTPADVWRRAWRPQDVSQHFGRGPLHALGGLHFVLGLASVRRDRRLLSSHSQ